MKSFFKTAFLRLLLIATVATVIYSGYVVYALVAPVSKDNTSKIVEVKSGDGLRDVAKSLYEYDLIRDASVFEIYARITGNAGKIVAGEYSLKPSMNIIEILAFLSQGVDIDGDERNITFIEGWTVNDIAEYLDKNGITPKDVFLKALLDVNQEQYSFFLQKKGTESVEGYLFPDTYRIFHSATATDIIDKALDNFDSKYDTQMRKDTLKAGRSIHDVVTLASILEWEVRGDEDRAMVADIFYKRLEKGMRLQSDATVNYVTGKKTPQASYDDLEVDSRYNTYKYNGLPPGPIGNPGLSAIRAAVYPKANDYWFFLTTRDGKVIYSKTFEEHVANKKKYLSGSSGAVESGSVSE